MRPEKKQLEILLITYFKNCYDEFPKGIVNPNESPDFTINMNSHHVLGIELTRLNPENAMVPDESALQIKQYREELIEFAKDLFEQKSPFKFFVKFHFSDKKRMVFERKIKDAVQIVNLIRNTVQHQKRDNFFKASILKPQLPNGLEEILIVHHPKLETGVWERSNNLGISNDVVDDIRNAIHKKDEKLRLYQKQRLNYYWLLITTDRLRGIKNFNLANKIMNQKFESSFQHVFLFDLIKSKVYKLV